MSGQKVFCVFEGVTHSDLYGQDGDGDCLVGIYADRNGARAKLKDRFDAERDNMPECHRDIEDGVDSASITRYANVLEPDEGDWEVRFEWRIEERMVEQ